MLFLLKRRKVLALKLEHERSFMNSQSMLVSEVTYVVISEWNCYQTEQFIAILFNDCNFTYIYHEIYIYVYCIYKIYVVNIVYNWLEHDHK